MEKNLDKKFWEKNFKKEFLKQKFDEKNVEKSFDKKNFGKINYKTKIFITKIYSNIDKCHTILASPFCTLRQEQGDRQRVMKTSATYALGIDLK